SARQRRQRIFGSALAFGLRSVGGARNGCPAPLPAGVPVSGWLAAVPAQPAAAGFCPLQAATPGKGRRRIAQPPRIWGSPRATRRGRHYGAPQSNFSQADSRRRLVL